MGEVMMDQSGVEESAPAAEVQEVSETAEPSGVESQVAAEPQQQDRAEIAFAKRLQAEREKWESEFNQKTQRYQKIADYMQRTSGVTDVNELIQRIEFEELQERAARENLTVEELQLRQKLQELESWKTSFEQQQQQQQQLTAFRSNVLEPFAQQHGANPDELLQYMQENQVYNVQAAFKAMQADKYETQIAEMQKQLENAKKEGVKEFLSSKNTIPTVEGGSKAGIISAGTPKTMQEASKRALARLSNYGQMEG